MDQVDEFYIGYGDGMPPKTRRAVKAVVVAVAAGVLAIAAGFVFAQRPLADSRFDYGAARVVEGYLELYPAPALLRPADGGWQRHWLVAKGKFGAARALGTAGPGWVRLRGTPIARGGWRMLEVVEGSLEPIGGGLPAPPVMEARPVRVRLRGEVVDSKCYLGVMNPGERTVHRDCAIRCLSGGVAPMFAFQDERGTQLALIVGAGDLRELAGRQVELDGTLSGDASAYVLTLPDGAP